jgi:hypothetical protein
MDIPPDVIPVLKLDDQGYFLSYIYDGKQQIIRLDNEFEEIKTD